MVSHKHKCIFIHIPKTAGMSIEDSFIRSLGLKFYNGQCPPLLLSYNQDNEIGPPSLAHLLPEDYVKHNYLSEELFEDYFKFSFIRNPWARSVSIYRYFKYHRILSFENFMKYRFPYLWEERYDFLMPQYDFLFDEKGRQKVDFIGKFENLSEDFELVRKKVNFSLEDLEHINKPPKPHNWYSRWNRRFIYTELKERPYLIKHLNLVNPIHGNYKKFYTTKAKDLVDSYYELDIKNFDYIF
jgi:hypothetical protein